MAGLVVLDASALIALYQSDDAHHEWAKSMFVDTVEDTLIMNSLTYAEVLVQPILHKKAPKFRAGIDGLGIDIRALSGEDAIELAQIRATTALRMPDAVVLFEALRSEATLATADSTLAREATNRGLRVLSPKEYNGGSRR